GAVESHRQSGGGKTLCLDVIENGIARGCVRRGNLGFAGRVLLGLVHRRLRVPASEQFLSRFLHEIDHSHGASSLLVSAPRMETPTCIRHYTSGANDNVGGSLISREHS